MAWYVAGEFKSNWEKKMLYLLGSIINFFYSSIVRRFYFIAFSIYSAVNFGKRSM